MAFVGVESGNRNAILIAASHLLQAIFIVIKIKFLTNFFSIDAYAQYAVLLSTLSVSVALASGGVDFLLSKKLVRAETRLTDLQEYLSRLLSLVLCIQAIAVTFHCFMFFALPSAAEKSLSLLLAGVLLVPLMSINVALLAICKGLNEVKTYARVYLFGSVVNSVSQCLLVFWLGDAGVSAVVVGSALLQAFAQAYLISVIHQKYNLRIKPRLRIPRWRYLKAGILIAGSKSYTSAIGMLSQFGLINFILAFAGTEYVASYYLYTGLTSQLANLVLIAVSGSFFPVLLREKLKGSAYLREAIYSQSLAITKIIFPILYTVIILQDTILVLVASESFASTGNLFDYMVCGLFMAVIKQSFDLSLQCHESNKYFITTASLGALTIILIPSTLLYFFGMNGLGLGLMAHSFIWLILLPLVSSYLYQFSLITRESLQILIITFLFIALTINKEVISVTFDYIIILTSCLVAAHQVYFAKDKLPCFY